MTSGSRNSSRCSRWTADEAERLGQDRVLAVPAAEQRNAGDGQARRISMVRAVIFILGYRPPILRHVLLVMAAVNDAAGARGTAGP